MNLDLVAAHQHPPPPTRASRLKVLHLMQCTNLGGMERVAYHLMPQLLATGGFIFQIATPRPFGQGGPIVRGIDPQAKAFDCRGRFGWRDLKGFRPWVRQAAKVSDLLWVTGTCAASLYAIRSSRLPKVLSHHFHHFEVPGSWVRWRAFYELLGRQLDMIVYPTEFTRAEAIVIAPWLEPRTMVIHNGIELRELDEHQRATRRRQARKQLGIPEDALVIGNGGWFVQRKRFDIFLDVAARVHAQRSDCVFVLCGGGPDEALLRRKAEELGIAEAVRFEGWVHSMTPYYEAFDFLLFNSDYDCFGRIVLEAASFGVLVIASLRYGGLSEFIQHGSNGILLSDHDRDALAEAILGLADSPRAPAMRAAAFHTIRSQHSIGAAAARTEQLFEHLCAPHTSTQRRHQMNTGMPMRENNN
jgi:glycosyltransferase involved in cell wall biosynthesis